MKILLNDFVRQWAVIGEAVSGAVERVGRSGWYVLGREVGAFEKMLAEAWGVRYAVGVGSGLDAIEIALRASGLRSGDVVLTTPLSAFATTLAVLRAGGRPVFVDVDDRGHLDLDLCEQVLKADDRVRFLLPVHLYGHAMDLNRLEAIREQYGVEVVEDCAQGIGARWQGRHVGAVGRVAVTSFYPTKNLGALGDGGAVLCASEELAEAARCLRDYGQSGRYEHVKLGLNSRLDEIQAAILADAMMPRVLEWNRERSVIASEYLREIANPALVLPVQPPESDSAWHLFPVLVAGGGREDFRSFLTSREIQSGVHYPVLIPDQPAMREEGTAPKVVGSLDRAKKFAANEVSLPIHPFLTAEERKSVIAACNEWSPWPLP